MKDNVFADGAPASTKLLSANQVAEILGVHVQTVRRWTRQGRIPYYKLGRAVRFHPYEIEDFINNGKSS